MTTHEIISATESPDGVSLTIRWAGAGTVTTQYYGTEAAEALGYRQPDETPVNPEWMIGVSREANARRCDRLRRTSAAEHYRSGHNDDHDSIKDAIEALRLALSRGHVVLAPVMPSEEEMLRGAREDAAQGWEALGNHHDAAQGRAGKLDRMARIQGALQARRNVYASLGAVGKAVSSGPVVPDADLREVASRAWDAGWKDCQSFLVSGVYSALAPECRSGNKARDVSAILESLKSGEA